jgi:SAM-dependent methyltransferase
VSGTFGAGYAHSYDELYAQKDYAAECDLIEKAVPPAKQRRILDLGCGTGGHAISLAQRGFQVVGVDLSEQMIRIAREKSTAQRVSIEWRVGDLVTVEAEGPFDAVIMMFAVLGYVTETTHVRAALRNVRRHLVQGGKFIFDVWYGPTVLMERPSERVKIMPQLDGTLVRAVRPTLRADRNIVDVETHLWRMTGDRVLDQSNEVHPVRYFFIPELEDLLMESSLRPDRFFAFPDLSAAPSTSLWNLGCIATAV